MLCFRDYRLRLPLNRRYLFVGSPKANSDTCQAGGGPPAGAHCRFLRDRIANMPKYTIPFSNKADRDLVRLPSAFEVNSKAYVVRKAPNLLCYMVVENNRDRTKKEVIPT